MSRQGLRAAALVGIVGCASVALVPAASAGGESARDVLTKAQDFVDDAKSVKYTGEIEEEVTDAVAGSGLVDRATLEESAAFPNRGQSLIEYPNFVTETLYVKKDVYIRDADSLTQLEGTKFGKLDPERPGSSGGATGEFFLFERPQDLGDALQSAQRPEILREGDGQTLLEVTFPAAELLSPGFEPLDEATGELLVTSEGEPKRLTLTASGPDSRLEVVYKFSRWNGRVTIEAPKKADLDPTPFIDEEAVAEYQDVPLYQPAAIPEGWVLDFADVLPAEETPEGCDQVEIDYVDPEDEVAGFMYIYLFPTACAFGAPGGSEEFVAGPYRGFVEEDPEFPGELFVEIDVDGTTVQVDTDLSVEALMQVLSNLVPLDLANPPPATVSVSPSA